MKKLILTLSFLSFITLSNAQDFSYGALGGISISNITGDATSGNSSKLSFSLGGFLEYQFNDKFGVQPELRYINVGAKSKMYGQKVNLNYSYIALPIVGKYYINDKFSANFGPQVAFNIGAKAKADGESESLDDVSGVDFGLLIGGGYNITEKIFVDLRYNFGLSNINSEGGGDFKQSHSAFFLSAGYRFN